jgi:subtilisin family serine protease
MPGSLGVYRNPPWIAGPQVLMANELDDVIDWGQLAHGLKDLWPLGTGKGVLVGVCDTGRPVHTDLLNRIKFSKNFSSSFTDVDKQGHSTHVCGTIAAEKNGRGVVGVAYEAELCIAKVLGDDGSGDNNGVSTGIRYCLERDCDIISMSLGGGYDVEIERAVLEAINAGKFVICAAGNEGFISGMDTVHWPARLAATIAVANYDRNGNIATSSSRGREVDIAFPGTDILSCWLDNAYRRLTGTSMATPFCSGLAALLLSHQRAQERKGLAVSNPIRNNMDLLDRFKANALDKGPVGHDDAWGWGIVDAKKFMELHTQGPVTPPGTSTTTKAPLPPEKVEDTPLLGGAIRLIAPVIHDGKKGAFIYFP